MIKNNLVGVNYPKEAKDKISVKGKDVKTMATNESSLHEDKKISKFHYPTF